MNIDEIIQIINVNSEKNLTSLQETILRQTWEGKTYANIATDLHYKQEYIRRVASHLWTCLTEIWGLELGKNNFRCTLEPKQLTEIEKKLIDQVDTKTLIKYIGYPDYPLPVDSPLYIDRPPLEQYALEEIIKPGSLIRIQGPHKYGKSSLILRILHQAKKFNYQTVTIDFQQADKSIFINIDKLLRWLSLNVARSLGIQANINDYWDDDIGTKVSCSIYFQVAILEVINTPLILVLNEVNRLFEYPDLADDFFSLLRYWYEQGKIIKSWEKLRLVVAYSTELYIPLNLNHTPFNIGLSLKLTPFNGEQVNTLINRYGLENLAQSDIENLIKMVGGHPYLIQIALYHLFKAEQNQQDLTLTKLLDQALNNDSIYDNHLQTLFTIFKQDTELKQAFLNIINDKVNRINIREKLVDKLDGMGLITCEENWLIPSCSLYAEYFKQQLSELNLIAESKIINNVDSTPKTFPNSLDISLINNDIGRSNFAQKLAEYWQKLRDEKKPLSFILCDIDYLKIYNDVFGYEAGDQCLEQITIILQRSLTRSNDLVFRYESDEFAIILPDADIYFAFQIAAKIRDKVRELQIPQTNQTNIPIPPIVTVSLGLASLIPSTNNSSNQLIQAAKIALSEAKTNGRDQVFISSLFNHGLIEN